VPAGAGLGLTVDETVIERSRDESDGRNVLRNFGSNAAYLKSIFQAG